MVYKYEYNGQKFENRLALKQAIGNKTTTNDIIRMVELGVVKILD